MTEMIVITQEIISNMLKKDQWFPRPTYTSFGVLLLNLPIKRIDMPKNEMQLEIIATLVGPKHYSVWSLVIEVFQVNPSFFGSQKLK